MKERFPVQPINSPDALPLHSDTPTSERSGDPDPSGRPYPHTHIPLLPLAIILSFLISHPSSFAQEAERQTKLILPKMVPEAKPVLVLPGWRHSRGVTSVSFSPDGRRLASGSADGTVILWDVESGESEMALHGHAGPVASVSFSPDGRKVASGSLDRTIILWDVESGKAERTLRGETGWGFTCISFSPDGRKLAATQNFPVGDELVGLWDLESGQLQKTWNRPQHYGHNLPEAYSVAFSPDGRRLAAGCNNGQIYLWAGANEQAEKILKGRMDRVTGLSFSPDGRKLASGLDGGKVILWDIESGQAEKTLETVNPMMPGENVRGLTCVSFSPDGNTLASGSPANGIILWDVGSGQAVGTFGVDRIPEHEQPGTSACPVSFSPDGSRLAWGSSRGTVGFLGTKGVQSGKTATVKGILLVEPAWPGASGRRYGRPGSAPPTKVEGLPVRPASPGRGGRGFGGRRPVPPTEVEGMPVGPASPRRGQSTQMVVSGGVAFVSFSPGGREIAFPHNGGVILWDTGSGQVKKTSGIAGGRLGSGTMGGQSVSFSPDGKRLAWVHGDDSVITWALGSRQIEKTFKHLTRITSTPVRPPTGQEDMDRYMRERRMSENNEYRKKRFSIQSVCFSPDGKKLASGYKDNTVVIWDMGSGQPEKTLIGHKDWVQSVCFSPDGTKFASGSMDGTVIIWDAESGRGEKTLNGHRDWVQSVSFSPDGNKLASGSADNTVMIWDVRSGRAEKILRGHTGWVRSVSFSPDGNRLASGSWDGTVKVWDTSTGAARAAVKGKELATFLTYGDSWLETTPEGYYDCSMEADKTFRWRLGGNLFPFDQFSERFFRPDLVRKALGGGDISKERALDGTQIPPTIRFVSPEYGSEVTGDEAEVVIETAGAHPIKRVEMTVTTSRVLPVVDRAMDVEDSTEKERTFRVKVPFYGHQPNQPTVRLRAVVYDTDGLRSRPAELFLRRAGTRREPGKLLLFSIGVSKYKNAAWNLGYPDADAIAVADTFETSLSTYFRSVQKRVLVNDQATISNVKFALRELKDNSTEEDAVILFLAGHGCMDEQGGYHSIVFDSVESDVPNTTLSWNDLGSLLREVRAQSLVMFADTCHAGSAIGRYEYEKAIGRLNQKAGAAVFSASRGDEASMERVDWGHGAFTKALLEGLGGAADTDPVDKRITTIELKDYLSARVPELTKDQQHPYVPRLDEFSPDTFICALPGYKPELAQDPTEKRQPAAQPPTERQKPGSSLHPAPPEYTLLLKDKQRFSCGDKFLDAILLDLLRPREIPFRLGSQGLRYKRVTVPLISASLEDIVLMVLNQAGATARWDGNTLVVESAQ